MKRNKDQIGRSMVEMLGVLAIIGVLSVGDIAGYKTAIKKHQSNELANALQLLDIQYESAKNAGKECTIKGEDHDNFNGVDFSYDANGFNVSYATAWSWEGVNCYDRAYLTIKSPYEITDDMCETLRNFAMNQEHPFYTNLTYMSCSSGCDDSTMQSGGEVKSLGGNTIYCIYI